MRRQRKGCRRECQANIAGLVAAIDSLKAGDGAAGGTDFADNIKGDTELVNQVCDILTNSALADHFESLKALLA